MFQNHRPTWKGILSQKRFAVSTAAVLLIKVVLVIHFFDEVPMTLPNFKGKVMVWSMLRPFVLKFSEVSFHCG